jgi:hypothetical protein
VKNLAFQFSWIVIILMAVFSLAFQPPEQISQNKYEQNIPKFKEYLPKWSKFISDSARSNFRAQEEVSVKGKLIFVKRDYDYYKKNKSVSTDLWSPNELLSWHNAGLIATTPEEVGTIIHIEEMMDQSVKSSSNQVYCSFKYRIFMIDALTGKIRSRHELKVDKLNQPDSISDYTEFRPNMDLFLESIKQKLG